MNCEQMMEWMQRFVDEDLPQAEQDILMAHIKQCPDCAASFEQLQHLSAELSRLPMVTPPFSIVDSILPRLAELDAQQASIQVAYLPEKILHKNSLFSWRIGAGFVAAAIFFSVIAVNLTPSSKKDAGEMLSASMNSKQEKAVQVQSSGAVDQGDITKSDTASPEAPEAAPAATAEPKAGKFGETTATTQKDKNSEGVQEKSIIPEQPQDMEKGTMYSITRTEESSAPSLASDDGNLIGFVERQIVKVRTPDGNRIYTSSVQWKSTDSIQLIKWEDNSHLTYEVTMEDGQLKRFVIDPILKTEQEQ